MRRRTLANQNMRRRRSTGRCRLARRPDTARRKIPRHGRTEKARFEKPVAKELSAADLHCQLTGDDPWKLAGGWRLEAAPQVKATGEEISKAGFADKDWMVATVPGTVLTTMIDRGIYPDPDYGLNNLAIPESLAHQDYWYRVEFKTPAAARGRAADAQL